LEAQLFLANFQERVNEISPKLQKVSRAIKEVRNSKKLLQFAEVVLAIGNFMNGQKLGALGFKIDNLNKLIDTKTIDNQKTLLHYVVGLVERMHPEAVNLNKEFPTAEEAAKIIWTGVVNDTAELKNAFNKTVAATSQIKFSDDDPYHVLNSALEGCKEKVLDLSTRVDEVTKDFASLEEYMKGSSDGTPEEFFGQLAKFLENMQRVRSELELERVKKERTEQKEKKIQSALLAEIQKGVALKKAPENTKKDPSHGKKDKRNVELAEMNQLAGQLLRKGLARPAATNRPTNSKVAAPNKLDNLLEELASKQTRRKTPSVLANQKPLP
jgi:hypothetical protein